MYVFRNVQVGGSFVCGMAFDTSRSDAASYNPNKPEEWPYELMCWGDDSSAQCSVPAAPTDYGSAFTVKCTPEHRVVNDAFVLRMLHECCFVANVI